MKNTSRKLTSSVAATRLSPENIPFEIFLTSEHCRVGYCLVLVRLSVAATKVVGTFAKCRVISNHEWGINSNALLQSKHILIRLLWSFLTS